MTAPSRTDVGIGWFEGRLDRIAEARADDRSV
jgi:hypothetical protein